MSNVGSLFAKASVKRAQDLPSYIEILYSPYNRTGKLLGQAARQTDKYSGFCHLDLVCVVILVQGSWSHGAGSGSGLGG